jgi:hypothetical protein
MRPLAAVLAATALFISAKAEAQDKCLSTPEAEALVITLAPDLLDGVARGCAPALAPDATLRAGLPPIAARYRKAAAAVAPAARTGITRLMGEGVAGADPAALATVMAGVLGADLAKSVKPADCPKLERAVRLLADVPPATVAGMAVMFLQLADKGKSDSFSICPDAKP